MGLLGSVLMSLEFPEPDKRVNRKGEIQFLRNLLRIRL